MYHPEDRPSKSRWIELPDTPSCDLTLYKPSCDLFLIPARARFEGGCCSWQRSRFRTTPSHGGC